MHWTQTTTFKRSLPPRHNPVVIIKQKPSPTVFLFSPMSTLFVTPVSHSFVVIPASRPAPASSSFPRIGPPHTPTHRHTCEGRYPLPRRDLLHPHQYARHSRITPRYSLFVIPAYRAPTHSHSSSYLRRQVSIAPQGHLDIFHLCIIIRHYEIRRLCLYLIFRPNGNIVHWFHHRFSWTYLAT